MTNTVYRTTNSHDVSEIKRASPRHGDLGQVPIRFAKGVGPTRARLLNKLGVVTVEDAVWFLPWRYEDRTVISKIGDLRLGQKATICGVVRSVQLQRTSVRRLSILTVIVDDGSGQVACVFFNQPYLESVLKPDTRVLITGVPSPPRGSGLLQMNSQGYEVLPRLETDGDSIGDDEVGRIVPIYHETKGLTSRHIRWLLRNILRQYGEDLVECLPDFLLERLQLPSFAEAVQRLHCPSTHDNVELLNRGSTSAHRRLAFEELLLLQLALGFRRRLNEDEPGIPLQVPNPLLSDLRANIPFPLTAAQERVIQDIARDVVRPICMNRLLQGDVGSGKTLVALHALVMACGSGYQAALMAPTEVLAEQHYLSLLPYFESLGISVALLRGGQSDKERKEILHRLRTGDAQVAIGTHALLQPDVQFARLGLAIIDEQHKFGVLQRARLRDKGHPCPHVLVMTATPIPRTLAMTAYGDLDVSVIDQLPPGRRPVKTLVFGKADRAQAYALVRNEIQAGRQAYIVYPLVEPSEKMDLQAAIDAARHLQEQEFASFRIGLLHGRMKTKDKQRVMAQFQAGQIDILVATTVIEVGVDVPNATVMLIEHAERFGLAQLHQLRGRVGRASWNSYCLLVSSQAKKALNPHARKQGQQTWLPESSLSSSPGQFEREKDARNIGWKRLEILRRCVDGFQLAEEDLTLRGPGTVLGIRQWGPLEFRVANLVRDRDLLDHARTAASELLQSDPNLSNPTCVALKYAMLKQWGDRFELGAIG